VKTLGLPEFRSIYVHTGAVREDTPVTRKKEEEKQVALTPIDLEAKEESPDVDYAYVAIDWKIVFSSGRGKGDDANEHEGSSGQPRPQLEYAESMQVSPDFFAMLGVQAAEGSLFTEDDMTGGENLLILGAELGKTLFADGRALGRRVTSWDSSYVISGILEPTGIEEYDNMAFTPPPGMEYYEELRKTLEGGGGNWVPPVTIGFGVEDPSKLDQARVQLQSWFDRKYGPGNVTISVPRDQVEAARAQTFRPALIVLFLSLAGLFTASVNVSNILLSRALRKWKTVGLLMALGSSRRNIFKLFLEEALVISISGAGLGALLSLGVWPVINRTMNISSISPLFFSAGLISAWVVTMAFTILPALRTSKVPAAEAIRNE